jgi:hypothetical protein
VCMRLIERVRNQKENNHERSHDQAREEQDPGRA